MPIRINFTGVTTSGFEPWPVKERIPFTIFEVSVEKGKESREPYLKVEFKHVDSNRKAWRNFSLQPQSLWALKKLLVDLEFEEDALEGEFEFDFADILGKRVDLRFGPERELDSGKKSQEVLSVEAPND